MRQFEADPTGYGQALAHSLFADAAVRKAFAEARATAQTLNCPLRLRLRIDPGAPELHCLRWETLCDPEDNSPLCTSENLLFSRYLSSGDWRSVRLRPKAELRALVVIANPNFQKYLFLSPVDVAGELRRAQESLGNISVTVLPEGETRATVNNLIARLRAGNYDVLYLVCYGTLKHGDTWLCLEDDDGQGVWIPGTGLAHS